ncbi:MAG: YjbH domain-containing protein [Gallionella sp.]|nr:YjbH domain-containing protein [Gallionella sp.]
MQIKILILMVCLLSAASAQAERLSDWLFNQEVVESSYPLGLMWEVESEKNMQRELRRHLLENLNSLSEADRAATLRLSDWLEGLPITGRVPVPSADQDWLIAHPESDPILSAKDKVILPARPKSVTVVTAEGKICQVTHSAGLFSRDYIAQCQASGHVDYAYVAQADGKTARYGVSYWNGEHQSEPAPGAWILSSSRDWPDTLSKQLITFLATQGPAPDNYGASSIVELGAPALSKIPDFSVDTINPAPNYPLPAPRDSFVSANDWGEVGLLQTPTARMRKEGDFAFNLSRSYPYTYYNIGFQPFAWMEAEFRYTSVSNRLYGNGVFGGQANKDKSIDIKFNLMDESAYKPELAMGIRDLAGTGLFSGEYFVANKRTGDFDWDLGLGWGYLGSRANVNNPFGYLLPRFNTRPQVAVGQGGNFAMSNYFRGRAAWFGGLQYQTAWDPLTLKLEFNGNNYKHEPDANNFPLKSPWNFGLVYRASNSFDISAGIERGNTAMVGMTMHSSLSNLSVPKLDDVPRIRVVAERPTLAPNWQVTGLTLESQTNWHVNSIVQKGDKLFVTIDDADVVYWKDYLDRAVAVLHRDAPSFINQFRFIYKQHGISVAQHVVDRSTWVNARTQFLAPSQFTAEVLAMPPQIPATNQALFRNPKPQFESDVGMNFSYSLGGPNGFMLFQLAPAAHAKYSLSENTWLQGGAQLGILDNYNKFTYNGFSNLPRVRTNVRKYVTTSKLTMPNLQLTHMDKLNDNHYVSMYGGYIESMFAGVGAEWMYRPLEGKYALGVDINEVKQRDFSQKLALQKYQVLTGHATWYVYTGWNNVLAKLSAGQYLAGDKGVTIDLSRVFDNGVKMGGYFTKTNVSAKQFGEGSFDKGIYFQIPFDAMLTKSVGGVANILWQPLLRDGGAKLLRSVQLYDLTNARDERALRYAPAPPEEAYTIPENLPNGIKSQIINIPSRAALQQTSSEATAEQTDYALKLHTSLYGLDFRNIKLSFDGTTLAANLSNERIHPISKAVGVAARTMLNLAPPNTQKIRVVYLLHAEPAIVYDFPNLDVLKEYIDGKLSEAEFRRYTAIGVINPAAETNHPLAQFNDLTPMQTDSLMDVVLPETGPVARVQRDYLKAGKIAWKADWLESASVGAGLIFTSGLLDKKAERVATNHANSSLLKNFNSVGNALPWLEAAGAAFIAVGSDDPRLSRTGYAASEAAMASFATVMGLKYAIGRSRPAANVGNRNFNAFGGSAKKNTDSFPSGHTIVAWSVLTPFAEEYDAPWLYGLAAITNISRVGGRNHWVSDTVAGSLLGYGIGDLFWKTSQKYSNAPHISVTPSGMSASWDLQ